MRTRGLDEAPAAVFEEVIGSASEAMRRVELARVRDVEIWLAVAVEVDQLQLGVRLVGGFGVDQLAIAEATAAVV